MNFGDIPFALAKEVPVDVVFRNRGGRMFPLMYFGPTVVVWSSKHEFLLERLHVLVPSEASLACS